MVVDFGGFDFVLQWLDHAQNNAGLQHQGTICIITVEQNPVCHSAEFTVVSGNYTQVIEKDYHGVGSHEADIKDQAEWQENGESQTVESMSFAQVDQIQEEMQDDQLGSTCFDLILSVNLKRHGVGTDTVTPRHSIGASAGCRIQRRIKSPQCSIKQRLYTTTPA